MKHYNCTGWVCPVCGEIVTAGRFYDDGGGVLVSNQNHRADLFNRRYR